MKSAIRSPLKIWPLVRFWLIKRPLRPLAFQDPSAFIARKLVSGSPSGRPPAPKRRKRARGRSGSPTGQPPAPEQRSARERRRGFATAVAEASAVARKVVSRSNGLVPSAKITEASASDAPLRGLTKRPLRLAGLDKVAILALDKNGSAWPDKFLTRDNMKSAIRSPNLKIWPLVRFWLIKRPLRPLAPKIPPLSSLGNLFREARPATPQRQNDGSEREGGCRSSFGRRPENCFGKPDGPPAPEQRSARERRRGFAMAVAEASAVARKVVSRSNGPAPSAKISEATASDAPLPGCRGSFNRRRESFLGKPDGPDPSVKTTGTSFRAARPARPKPKPSMILRVAKNGTRRARAGFLRTLNPKRF